MITTARFVRSIRLVTLLLVGLLTACGGCGDGSGSDNNDNNGGPNNRGSGAGSCDPVAAGCDADAVCEARPEGTYCYCPDGFQGDGDVCVALGACDDDPGVCGENASCAVRSAGSFCACDPGFQGDGFTCRDLDECERLGSGVCGVGTCVDVEGGYECDCPEGYGGKPCADIDECTDTPDICGAGTCTNEDPGYTCTCEFGYTFDGTTCVDVDECATGAFQCPADRTCKNEPGTYSCGCPPGFTGDGDLCTVLVECQTNPGACDANASCESSPDGDTCVCDLGWAGDGASCHEAGWAMLTAGATSTCGILEDRTLWCWGNDSGGVIGVSQPNFAATPVRIGAPDRYRYVDLGARHACAIRGDQTLWCWGENPDGRLGFNGATAQPRQVGSDADWKMVSASREQGSGGFTCGIRTGGTLWCWGANEAGQLGLGTTQSHEEPQQLGTDSNWSMVDAGQSGACAIKTDRTMWCWGGTPRQIEGEWIDVSVSAKRTCATTPDDTMFCWSTLPAPGDAEPFEVSGGPVWSSPSVGRDHLCAVQEGGAAYCMGDGSSGQIGRIFPPGSSAQWQQAVSGTYTDVVSGFEHTCAIASDRTAHCWGRNLGGELGGGTAGTTATPRRVGLDHYLSVDVGELHACALAANNTITCWGNNFVGQTGDSHFNYYTTAPQRVVSNPSFRVISVGKDHSCARDYLSDDGALLCFGGNGFGQIGSGNVSNDDTAYVEAGAVPDEWTLVAAGGEFTCGIAGVERYVWCWGKNDRFQLGLGTNSFNYPTPTNTGLRAVTDLTASLGSHACAINADQNMYCWGDNREGQLGTGSPGSEPDPTYTAKNAQWTDVDAGLAHTCGITTAGTLWCWGNNDDGQHGVGTRGAGSPTPVQVGTRTTWASVSAAASHTCAIDGADGALYCWGRGDLGQIGNGAWVDALSPTLVDPGPWSAVGAGTYATCAVKSDESLYCWGHGVSGLLADGSAWSLDAVQVVLP